jgi:KaiC/GvpD/RAD55 family RecA-like ATPase/TolA-binding protein
MEKKEIASKAIEFAAIQENIERDKIATGQIRDFLARYPFKEKPELLRTVAPNDLYDRTADDRFFNWLTERTDSIGETYAYEKAIFPEAVRRFDFLKVLLTVLVSDRKSVSFKIDQNWGVIPGFGGDKLIAKKLLSIYYWERVIPVFRTQDLEQVSSQLGIPFRNSALQKYRKDYSLLSVGQKFELLNSGLMDFKSSYLEKLTNTMFASFLCSELLPSPSAPKASPAPVPAPAAEEAAGPKTDDEVARLKQDYEARLREADRTISELRNETRNRRERIDGLEEKLRLMEEEIGRREADLKRREELMQEQLRQSDNRIRELSDSEKSELKRIIAELTKQIEEKEERVKSLEKKLSEHEGQIRIGESDFIDGEIGTFESPAPLDENHPRAKTGIQRLDDLLKGGLPVGSQIIVYGPSFIGKEIAIDSFAAQGLSEGIPLIWITTDRTIDEIREEMSLLLSNYAEHEKNGLVFYIDAYSRIVGDTSVSDNTAYLDDSGNVESIGDMTNSHLASIDAIVKEKGYRLVFRSVSSLSANHDIKNIFALLRQFVARRRKDRCIGMYSIEKGIMSEQDLQIISSIMDGVIEFSTDTKNNFLAVRGICETETRDRIQYTVGKNSLNIGSFFLGRIK